MSSHTDEVRELVARQLGRCDVDLADRLVEDLDADSVDLVTIVAILEEAYGVSVDEERLGQLRTVNDIAEEIARLRGGG